MPEARNTSRWAPRRRFVKTVAAFSTTSIFADLGNRPLWGQGFDAARAETSITNVFMDLNNIHKWDQSNGDTWDPFWADDDNLYAFNCDGRGFGAEPRNLAFNQLLGDSPHALKGRIVNSMDEYGTAGKKEADNATWKACVRMENFPRLSQVVVFTIKGLPDGIHTIEIVNKSTAGAVLDAFRGYGSAR